MDKIFKDKTHQWRCKKSMKGFPGKNLNNRPTLFQGKNILERQIVDG
jgi:hypothetical protein